MDTVEIKDAWSSLRPLNSESRFMNKLLLIEDLFELVLRYRALDKQLKSVAPERQEVLENELDFLRQVLDSFF